MESNTYLESQLVARDRTIVELQDKILASVELLKKFCLENKNLKVELQKALRAWDSPLPYFICPIQEVLLLFLKMLIWFSFIINT